jgi:AbrB family looped-hinge helix DNA binding protein
MGEKVKVLQKGKITIPATIRQKLGINEGDFITLEIVNNRVVILPPNTVRNPTESIRGLAKTVKISEPIEKELAKASAAGMEDKLKRAKVDAVR